MVWPGLDALHRSYVLWQSLRDFVDRRDYQTLAKDLPPKTEATVMVPLAPLQQQLYEAFLQHHGHHGDLIKHGRRGRGSPGLTHPHHQSPAELRA